MKKSIRQSIWDFIGIPFRFALFDQTWLPRFHWTTLEDERLNAVLPFIQGELLDIGAGPNTLVKRYGRGQGVDIYDWGGGAKIVKDTSNLPFKDETFDTITFIACLNHIPNRLAVLKETRRLIKPDGQILITMINPSLGNIGHTIWWYSEDKKRGGMAAGELGGMSTNEIVNLCTQAGFTMKEHIQFTYKLNNLYIFSPK